MNRATAIMPTTPHASETDERLAFVRELYHRHCDFVWRAAARLGVAEHERDDVLQDVFVVVHRRLSEYEGRGAITTWLYGIVRGLVWNRRRLATRRRHLRALAPPVPVATEDPQASEAFARFIGSLPTERREAFVLSEVEGMSGPEIAEALGVNLNTVYTRLRAAKKALRRFAIAELGAGEGEGPQ